MTRSVLIVCTANRCRSPMAGALLAARAAARPGGGPETSDGQEDLHVRTAGTWAAPGQPPTDHAVAVMAERGHDISDHRSDPVSAELLDWADIILVMTRSHRDAIAAEFPDTAPRIKLFSELSGAAARWDVEDPVGGTLEDYRATADELQRLIAEGWGVITGRTHGERAP